MSTRTPRGPILLALGILFWAMLACGGFQVRVTPTPKPVPTAASPATPAPTATASPTVLPTRPVTLTQTVEATITPLPLLKGLMKVVATGGVNARAQPGTTAQQVGRFNANTIVTVIDGPITAEGYSWWKVTGANVSGWVASGPADDPWLVAYHAADEPTAQPAGTPKLVDRPIKLGDRVQVTTAPGQPLTIREAAGKIETARAKVLPGTRFTVRGGPVKQDGLTWWELEGDAVKGWAAEGDSQDRWLTPVE